MSLDMLDPDSVALFGDRYLMSGNTNSCFLVVLRFSERELECTIPTVSARKLKAPLIFESWRRGTGVFCGMRVRWDPTVEHLLSKENLHGMAQADLARIDLGQWRPEKEKPCYICVCGSGRDTVELT